ncbi:hypothetical protein B0H19DRAFT_1250000 [Mycena capillaripes]|nr:hypothetical protein B0H19DRAFT_1250000 [Mycena capillaripes]
MSPDRPLPHTGQSRQGHPRRAPYKIRNLFPNIRSNVYAILEGKTTPKTITIRGSPSTAQKLSFTSPSHSSTSPNSLPAIHALAVRKIIQDLEDGQHALARTLANPDDTDLLAHTVKASIVRLGKTCSIISPHTRRRRCLPCLPLVAVILETAISSTNVHHRQATPLKRLRARKLSTDAGVLRVVELKWDILAVPVRNALPAGATDAVVATMLAMAFHSTKLGAGSWGGPRFVGGNLPEGPTVC